MRPDHPQHSTADAIDVTSPESPSPSRRQWLLRSMPLVTVGTTIGVGLGAAWLFNERRNDRAAPLAAFMKVSQALTGRTTLDPDVANRIFNALEKNVPHFSLRIQQLAAAMDAGQSDFPLAAADTAVLPADPRQALATVILRSWYLGVVDGVTVADRQALMYAAVDGVLPVRGYCGGTPGFWADKPAEG